MGALIGLGFEGEPGLEAGAMAGAEAAADGVSVFSDDDAWDVLQRRSRRRLTSRSRTCADRAPARGSCPSGGAEPFVADLNEPVFSTWDKTV